MELETILETIGLEPKGAKVYLACLQLGQETAFNIAKKSGLKRPTVYVILDKLISEGLIAVTKTRKATYYSPLAPQKLIGYFKEKEKKLENALPDLESLYNIRPQKPKIQVFEGKSGIEVIYREVVDSLKKYKEVLSYGTLAHFNSAYQNAMVYWLNEAKNKNYKIREILTQDGSEIEYIKAIKKNKNHNHQLRLMPKDLKFINNDNIIYGNKLAIFSVQKDLFVILVESEDIINSYRNFFEMAWKQAVKVKK